MFKKIGNLSKYWHVIALSSELKKGSSLKRDLYGVPMLLWRSTDDKLHAVQDVCAHKRAPLEICDYANNQVRCQYHGWEYNSKGELTDIPSSKQLTTKLKCKLEVYEILDQNGFIWILLEGEMNVESLPEHNPEVEGEEWKHHYASMVFETAEELLIENFMDATHTAVVHDKLIRDEDKKTSHQVIIEHSSENVKVTYEENKVKVGIGLNWMLGKNVKVRHTDEFLCPNLVRVNYMFNSLHRFQAFIACTPLQEGKTIAFIRLSYKFGMFNNIIKWVIPYYAKKVLIQDFDITQLQYKNQQIFNDVAENHIDCDYTYNKIKKIRRNKMKGLAESESAGVQKIEINI